MAALHCQADDACVFVDAMPLDDAKASISQATPGVTCHYLQEQSQFLARHPFIAQGTRGFRWIHVDGYADLIRHTSVGQKQPASTCSLCAHLSIPIW